MKVINQLALTNKLLIILVVPVVFYILKLLSFIFIPLVSAFIIALLFMPIIRWSYKKNIPKWITMTMIVFILFLLITGCIVLIRLSSQEILSIDASYWQEVIAKMNNLIMPIVQMFGIDYLSGQDSLSLFLNSDELAKTLYENLGKMLGIVQSSIAMFLMALFFIVLLLAGSINVQKLMENTLFKKRLTSIRTFMLIEKSIVKFLMVKFLISIATGLSFGVVCYFFDIKFPVFWGLLAFGLHFIQLVGSIISSALLLIFSFAQIDHTGTLVAFILIIIGIQILFGSVLEPIFMGQTFSINTITILIMLMFWGYLWGIPGLILSVPITVALKTILDQFPRTQVISKIMS